MKHVQSIFASFCVFLTASQTYAQEQPSHWYSSITRPYEPKYVPPANIMSTTRLSSLLRDGRVLYLSLQDAIALALENNIDIEVERAICSRWRRRICCAPRPAAPRKAFPPRPPEALQA